MPYQIIQRRAFAKLAGVAVVLAGCAGQPLKTPPPVYPPPPAEPRYIYDTSLRSEQDVSAPTWGDRVLAFIGGGEPSARGFSKPYGIAVKQHRIYVTDTQQRAVLLFDLTAHRLQLLGADGPGSLQKPLGIAISSQNEIYVVDGSAKQVKVFDWDGRFVRALGDKQTLQRPSGIALDPQGKRCYVVDTGGVDSDRHHVVVLDSQQGTVISTIGHRGAGDGEFNLPLQAATDAQGRLYVVDGGNFRVQVFDAQGKFVRAFGGIGHFGGQFSRPKGIALDNADRAYVIDTAFGNFQIFDNTGQLLLHVGDRGTGGGPGQFMLPSSIAVDEDGRVYVVDQFFRKVDIFRPVALTPLQLLAK